MTSDSCDSCRKAMAGPSCPFLAAGACQCWRMVASWRSAAPLGASNNARARVSGKPRSRRNHKTA